MGRTENASMENVSNGGWVTQVRKNRSTNLRRVKMQVWKTQVLIWGRGGKHKYENVKRVHYAFPLACLALN